MARETHNRKIKIIVHILLHACSRYAMKRMRRKFKAMQRDINGRAVDWRTLYMESKANEEAGMKDKKKKKKNRDKNAEKREKERKKRYLYALAMHTALSCIFFLAILLLCTYRAVQRHIYCRFFSIRFCLCLTYSVHQ